MRLLAHQLRANLENENVFYSKKRAPLQQRLGRVFDSNQVWATTEQNRNSGELRARAQRGGSGRVYLEDVVLKVEADRLEMSFTRWVNDHECGQSYCGGSWRYSEDLRTGRYNCIRGQGEQRGAHGFEATGTIC